MASSISEKFHQIRATTAAAAKGRTVRIIGVSKTQPAEKLEEAFSAGVETFGENRIQEAIPKIKTLSHLDAEWHFIGHLQTNKARDAVRYFSFIQSVDSIRLLQVIEKEAEKAGKEMPVLLEVNLAEEVTKHGMNQNQVRETLDISRELRRAKVRGLMVIPPFLEDPEAVRPYFRQLREIRDRHSGDFPSLTELSMGMSHDYVVAVEEGATMIRIGTALFGERKT
jgi:pyridoxal phosphate enzyme (YggS family)